VPYAGLGSDPLKHHRNVISEFGRPTGSKAASQPTPRGHGWLDEEQRRRREEKGTAQIQATSQLLCVLEDHDTNGSYWESL